LSGDADAQGIDYSQTSQFVGMKSIPQFSAIKAHPFILLTTFSFCTKFAQHQRLVARNYEFSEMGSVDSLGL
jgi:hypothetical protein